MSARTSPTVVGAQLRAREPNAPRQRDSASLVRLDAVVPHDAKPKAAAEITVTTQNDLVPCRIIPPMMTRTDRRQAARCERSNAHWVVENQDDGTKVRRSAVSASLSHFEPASPPTKRHPAKGTHKAMAEGGF